MNITEQLNELLILVTNCYNNKELVKAEYYLNKAYQFAAETNQMRDKIASMLNDKALFLILRRDFANAKKCFDKSLEIKQSLQNLDQNSIAVTLNGLGITYKFLGDNERSLNYTSKAAEIAKVNKHIFLPTHYCDLARIQKITNKKHQARQTYKKSITTASEMLKVKSDNLKYYEQIIYNCHNDLSEIELSKSNLHQAKHQHQKALEVLENSKSDISSFFEAYKRFEIPAKMWVYQKQYIQAIDLFKQAKAAIIEEYQGFEVGKDLANIMHQIGDCYTAFGQHQKALQTYQQAVEAVCNNFHSEDIEDLPNIDNIYNKRSAIASLSYKAASWFELYDEHQNQNYLFKAFQTYQLIAKLLPVTRRDYVEENSKFQLADETQGIYEKAMDTCWRLHQLMGDEQYLEAAFYFTESSKAIVLQEKLQAEFALKGMEQNVQQQDVDFRSKIAFYQSSINTNKATKGDAKQLKNWESELWNCKEAYERFQQKIETENPNYYQVKYAQSLTNVKDLQEKLSPESALIEYFTGADNLYVFVITQNNYKVNRVNMCSKQQLEDIQLFKSFIHQFNKKWSAADYENFKTLGYQLYQKLLAPALEDLDASIHRLIIIPDGLLNHITFEALLTSENCHRPSAYYHPKNLDYVFKEYALSYYYSASLLANTYHEEENTYLQTLTGFAPALKDLHRNQEEVIQINTHLQGEVLLNEKASLQNFQQKAKESQIIHLSTHAKCNTEDTQLSSIEFHNKEYLNINNIENMKTHAGLIVLSACETGYGSIQSGEGAMSLTRSFFISGCPSLVASLWLANDESTAKIMLYFYQYLKNGAKKDVALQQAKLQYCSESGLLESHPFYWAGFVQFGNRRGLF